MKLALSICYRIYCLFVVLVLLNACARQYDYLQSKSLPPLSVSEEQQQRLGQLYPIPETDKPLPGDFRIPFPPTVGIQENANIASMQTMGDRFWVLNAKPPATTWTQLINFFEVRNIPIAQEDLKSATLTTEPFFTGSSPNTSLLQYQLRLEKGFQPDTTEIIFSNRFISEGYSALSYQRGGHLFDNRLHAERLAEELTAVLNNEEQAIGDSFLATTIELPDKVQMKEADGEPILLVFAPDIRLLSAFSEALNGNDFVLYDLDKQAQVFHFNRYQAVNQKSRWYNPFSWWKSESSPQSSPYSLTFILSTLPDESEVREVFDRTRTGPRPNNKPKDIPGYLLTYQQQGEKYIVYVRDGYGRQLSNGEARDLLDAVRLRLI